MFLPNPSSLWGWEHFKKLLLIFLSIQGLQIYFHFCHFFLKTSPMEDLVTPMSETQIMFIIDISKIIRSHKFKNYEKYHFYVPLTMMFSFEV